MTNTNATVARSASGPTPGRGGIAGLLQRSDAAKGYALLMPTLLVLLIGIVLPFAILVTISFWTPVGFEFNTDPTLKNYRDVVEQPVYGTLWPGPSGYRDGPRWRPSFCPIPWLTTSRFTSTRTR